VEHTDLKPAPTMDSSVCARAKSRHAPVGAAGSTRIELVPERFCSGGRRKLVADPGSATFARILRIAFCWHDFGTLIKANA
jgi:hypothetical protein